MHITKAVIPAAGLGTRFLPYTKSVPKEMLPIVDKPAIHYIAQECIDAQVPDIIFIINDTKSSLIHYFTHYTIAGHDHKFDELNHLIAQAKITYIDQHKALGLGHAVSLAQDAIGNCFFSVLLPDDLIIGRTPELTHLINRAQTYQTSIIAVQEVPHDLVSSYGIIDPAEQVSDGLWRIKDLVEKPEPHRAPSRLAIVGRYIFSPTIFAALQATKPNAAGELQLTDAIRHMIHELREPAYAHLVQGTRYDLGTPAGWAHAVCSLTTE